MTQLTIAHSPFHFLNSSTKTSPFSEVSTLYRFHTYQAENFGCKQFHATQSDLRVSWLIRDVSLPSLKNLDEQKTYLWCTFLSLSWTIVWSITIELNLPVSACIKSVVYELSRARISSMPFRFFGSQLLYVFRIEETWCEWLERG